MPEVKCLIKRFSMNITIQEILKIGHAGCPMGRFEN